MLVLTCTIYVSPEEVFERPTFKAFCALLDNYERQTVGCHAGVVFLIHLDLLDLVIQGVAETVSWEEREENTTFLNAIMETPVMTYLHKYANCPTLLVPVSLPPPTTVQIPCGGRTFVCRQE